MQTEKGVIEMTVNILWMYPDLLNLYGDRGNIMAIKRICESLGADANIIRIDSVDDDTDFENSDLMLFSPGELTTVSAITDALREKIDAIKEYVENEKYILSIGTSAAIFGGEVKRLDRPSFNGLGIGRYDMFEREAIYGDDLIFSCTPTDLSWEVAGSQIQIADMTLHEGAKEFGEIIYGYGNAHDGREGSRYKNFITTNALGPVFVKNPWIIADIIADILRKKGQEVNPSDLSFELEQKSLAAIKRFNKNKKTNL